MKTKRGNQKVGFVNVKVLVSNPADSAKSREIELLVDTGATLSVIPRSVLEGLGVQPLQRRRFRSFGGFVEKDVGGAVIQCQENKTFAQVIFGEEGDMPVLRVTALESLGYRVDPVTGELKPTEMLLL